MKIYIDLRTTLERIVPVKPPSAVRARPPIPGTGERELAPHPTYTAPALGIISCTAINCTI